MLPSTQDSADAYGALHERIAAHIATLADEDLERTVPACPDWTVHDLIGHLVGEARDVASLNIEGAATDAWTDAQVQWARPLTLTELLDDWAEHGPAVAALLPHAPPASASQLVFDVCTHEQDLHGALGTIGPRDHDQMLVALGFVGHTLDELVRELGLVTIELVTASDRWVAGDGEVGMRIEGSRFDLLRATGGRRTRDELDVLVTLGSLEPIEILFAERSPLHIPEHSLGE